MEEGRKEGRKGGRPQLLIDMHGQKREEAIETVSEGRKGRRG